LGILILKNEVEFSYTLSIKCTDCETPPLVEGFLVSELSMLLNLSELLEFHSSGNVSRLIRPGEYLRLHTRILEEPILIMHQVITDVEQLIHDLGLIEALLVHLDLVKYAVSLLQVVYLENGSLETEVRLEDA
jgi:hypothetical protein